MAFKSPSLNLDCRDREGTEPRKKVKKLRSIKLSKMPTLKPSAKPVKTQFNHVPVDSFNDDASSKPSQTEFSSTSPSTSPNFIKKESSQASLHDSESTSSDKNNPIEKDSDSWKPNIVSFGYQKPVGNPGRVLSLKSNRPLKTESSRISPFPNLADYVMPHQDGNESDGGFDSSSSSSEEHGMRRGTELKKTLKKSRSIRLSSRSTVGRAKSRFNQPNYLKATSSSEGKKMNFQASLHNSESSFGGSVDENRRNSSNSKSNSGSSSLKSMRTLRRTSSSLRSLKILVKKSSFKSKRSSMKKCSQNSEDMNLNKATCSSTLKDSKFPQQVGLHPVENEPQRVSVMKVCPYNYCSLHGHHHSPAPPLKRLLSKRRRLLKTQKSIKLRSQSSQRAKYNDDIIKAIETEQMVFNGDPDLQDKGTPIFPGEEEEGFGMSVQIHTKSKRVLENADLIGISGEPSNVVTRSTPDNMREATEGSSAVSSASISHTLEEFDEVRNEKNGDLATDHETIGQFAAAGHSTAREVSTSWLHKKKHISMWNLIHQHMVTENRVDDTNRLPEPQSSGCSPSFPESSQNMGVESHNTDNQEIELHKMFAIKMVREAIEKILLPEVQDKSPHDQSISSELITEQELVEQKHGECDELSIPNLTSDTTSGPEQEVGAAKDGEKAEKRTPKGWSNLKKLILLKRFIKELEKVKKFKPRKSRHLPLEPAPEAEKVCLRKQMIDRKKSSDEWMLDYALQQVVSELAPTQKQKVALLIKAFETVVPSSDEQQNQVIFPMLKGIRHEGSCTESELDKCVSEASYRDKKVEDILTSNLDNGDKNSIIADKQSNVPSGGKAEQVHEDRMSTSNFELLKDDSASIGQQLYMTKSRSADDTRESADTDNIASSASDGGSFKQLNVVGQLQYGDSDLLEQQTNMLIKNSTFIEFCKEDNPESKSKKLEIDNLIGATDELPSIPKRSTSENLAEAAADNTMISPSCVSGPLDEANASREQRNGDSDLETESTEGLGPVTDSQPDNSSQEAYKTDFDKEKHVSMWQLIHQQMVAGLATEGKTKQLDKENEEHLGDTNAMAATESQEVEIRKNFAIKLVREAIEKILLPEVQDHSSDDQSITSEVMSDQELIETNGGEGGEPSISTSTDSANASSMFSESSKARDDISASQEGTGLSNSNVSESENEKTASKVQNKSDKQTPKSWSNLKKMILLRRFVKELEKVKKFNPRKPRHLPLKSGPEPEEVSLRHQMMDEKKSTERWMLDYALQKVISELAPKQKRKVALLVKAFETVAPPSEEPQVQVTFPKFKVTSLERCCSESEQDKFVSKATEADIKVKDIVTANPDNGDDNSTFTDKKTDVAVDEEAQKDSSDSIGKSMELDGLSGVNVEPSYATKSSAPNGRDESRESEATYSIVPSASDCDPLEQLRVPKENRSGNSETDCNAKVTCKTQLDKQKYISMWHQLCQHVVSGIATKVENELLDGQDEDEQVDSAKKLSQISNDSCHDYSRAEHDRSKEDYDSSGQKLRFSQSDAVKLVQEAIEEILVPEIQDDSSDSQSIASDIFPEQELLEKNNGSVEEPNYFNSIDSTKDVFRGYEKSEIGDQNMNAQEEKGSAAQTIPVEQRAVSMVGNKSDQQKPKNWNKLKKLLLLKRSIKALEKARKSKLQALRNLPLEPATEEEKVDLRHRLKDERKKAEEWMLDYSLQHIVTKLTPARKRRVAMLVEAFEAVVPLPEI